jgi:hypothetical protein
VRLAVPGALAAIALAGCATTSSVPQVALAPVTVHGIFTERFESQHLQTCLDAQGQGKRYRIANPEKLRPFFRADSNQTVVLEVTGAAGSASLDPILSVDRAIPVQGRTPAECLQLNR